jgi:ribonucleoside-diphosphate reductase alpha chain
MMRSRRTSILDYIFRELAISYLGRHDLAHVDPSEIGNTVIGAAKRKPLTRVVFARGRPVAFTGRLQGLVRGSDKLMVIQGGGGFATHGATALKGEFGIALKLETGVLDLPAPTPRPASGPSINERRAEAQMKGYVGESCPECANFTLVRNGTCLKCDT